MKQINFRDSSLADSLEIVLEPRVMFDGAAVATAVETADQVNQQLAASEVDSSDVKSSHNLADTHSDSEKNSDLERNVSLVADENTPPVVENTQGDKFLNSDNAEGTYDENAYLKPNFGGINKDGTVSWIVGSTGQVIVYELNDNNQFVKVADLNLSSNDYDGAKVSDFVLGKDDKGNKGYVALSDGRIVELILDNNKISISEKTIQSTDAGLKKDLDLAISTDGKYLFAIASKNGNKLVSFDISTGQKVGEVEFNGDSSPFLEYADGHLIVAEVNGNEYQPDSVTISSIKVNDNGSLTDKVSFETNIKPSLTDYFRTAVSSDGSKFALYAGNDYGGDIQIFDINNGTVSRDGTVSHVSTMAFNISFDSSGNNVIVVDDSYMTYPSSKNVTSFRINFDNSLGEGKILDTKIFTRVTNVLVSDSGTILITGDKAGLYTSNEQGYFGQVLDIGSQLRISDSELDPSNNWNGASVVINSSVTGGVYSLSGSDYTVENGVVKDGAGNTLATFSQNAPKDGSLTIKFTGIVTADQAKSIVKALTYRVDDGQPGRVVLTVTVNDGSQDSSPVELGYVLAEGLSIDINGAGDKIPFNKDGTALFPNADIKLADSDAANDQLKIQSTDTGASFAFLADSGLTIDGRNIKKDGQTLGAFSQENGVLTITFEKNSTKDDVKAVLQHLVYKSESINPGDDVSFSVTYTDRTLGLSRTVDDAAVVHENKAPYFNLNYTDPLPIESGENIRYQFPDDLFKDDDGENSDLKWNVSDLPNGLTFHEKDRTLTGTVPVDSQGFKIKITVTDKEGLSSEAKEIEFKVAPNEPPLATNENSDFHYVEGDPVSVNLGDHFTDPNKEQKLNYTVSEGKLPDGLTLNQNTGKIESTKDKDIAPGHYEFTIKASDGLADATKHFTLEVRSNSLPTLVSSWAQDGVEIQQGHCSVTAGEPVHLDLNKTIVDPDGDPVTIKEVKNLPEGLVFDSQNGAITGKVNGLINADILITVTDGRGTDTVLHLSFHSDNPPFTVPVTQFQHAPLYDPAAAHELEEDLLMPVAPTSDLPDASIDLAGSSTPFATSQGLSMAMAALQASEPGSKGLSGAALLSAAQVARSVQHGDVAQPLHGMDQTGKAAPVRAGSSMTLPTQGDKGTPVDEFLWQGSNVILDGTPTPDGAPVAPSTAAPAQVSMAGKPALTQQVHERSAYGDEQPSAKA